MTEKQVETFNELLNEIWQQMADIRGEAIAAKFLATAALELALSKSANKRADFEFLAQKLDEIQEGANYAANADPALIERQKEVTRLRAEGMLSTLQRGYAG